MWQAFGNLKKETLKIIYKETCFYLCSDEAETSSLNHCNKHYICNSTTLINQVSVYVFILYIIIT